MSEEQTKELEEVIDMSRIEQYILQLQQENKELKKNLYSPDVIDTTCPKCGEKYLINYSRDVYDLKQENEKLKETLKGTTHCFDEEEHKRLLEENKKLKEKLEENTKIER